MPYVCLHETATCARRQGLRGIVKSPEGLFRTKSGLASYRIASHRSPLSPSSRSAVSLPRTSGSCRSSFDESVRDPCLVLVLPSITCHRLFNNGFQCPGTKSAFRLKQARRLDDGATDVVSLRDLEDH